MVLAPQRLRSRKTLKLRNQLTCTECHRNYFPQENDGSNSESECDDDKLCNCCRDKKSNEQNIVKESTPINNQNVSLSNNTITPPLMNISVLSNIQIKREMNNTNSSIIYPMVEIHNNVPYSSANNILLSNGKLLASKFIIFNK